MRRSSPISTCDKLDKLNRDFLWGHDEKSSKIHLVDWDTICLSKSEGGLGIRKARHMNQALLAKVSWRITDGEKSLWADMMRNKYLKGRVLLDTKTKAIDSSTWKGICHDMKVVKKGIRWVVGNGQKALFWRDNWNGEGSLLDWATQPITSTDLNSKVEDYLEDFGWDVSKLRQVLPMDIIHRITPIHVGRTYGREDSIIWGADQKGTFSTKSAYWLSTNHDYRERD